MSRPRRERQQRKEIERRRIQSDLAAQGRAGSFPASRQGGGVVQQQRVEHYTGPLPHPKLLKDYDELIPGSADRIIQNFEKEADHRRALERDESDAANRSLFRQLDLQRSGQWFGLIVVFMGFMTAGYAFHLGKETGGMVVGSADIVALVALFITGKRGRVQPDDKSQTDLTRR